MNKNKREIVKRLRFLAVEVEQLDALLKSENMIFTDFVHHLIAEEIKRKTHSVIRVEAKVSEEIDTNRKRRRRAATIFEPRPAPKLDLDFLRELGRIGNNVNQIARSLNYLCLQQQHSQQQFSFLECLDELQKIQRLLHAHLQSLPIHQRSEQAVENARARAIAVAEIEVERLSQHDD